MSAALKSEASVYFFFYLAVIILLTLSAFNLHNYSKSKEVLGLKTEIPSNTKFWEDFLIKNPDYIPGWIELGRWDKVKKIDPNYPLPQPEAVQLH